MELLITGGEQGLGKAIIDELRPDNVRNIYGDDIRTAVKEGRLKSYIDDIVGMSNMPSIVVNNYGINHLSWIGRTPEEDKDIMEINVMLPYWVINSLAGRGQACRVLNISSQTHSVAQRTTSLYCASKAALSHMTKVMARELAPKGWVINAFAPGKILGTKMTEMTDNQVEGLRNWTKDYANEYATGLIPMGRFMTLEEAAKIAVHILNTPSYVNGTTIDAFGGL